MIKKEINTGRSIHRIDLSLPVVQTDSYEIFYAVPSTQNLRHQKPLVDINKKTRNHPSRIRSPARLKHLTGPVFINSVVDIGGMTTESSSTMNDAASNPLTNSNHSNRIFKGLPPIHKRTKQQQLKDDGDRSSSDNRLLYESVGSFDDYYLSKTRNTNMWQNIHHPQLSSSKALHIRRTGKYAGVSNPRRMQRGHTTSLDNLSQESVASANEQLYERIEQLTKAYFPTIQQIRHMRPSPELVSNRMRLHREQRRSFMPVLSRTRVVR
jgi:hypothetical protein